MLEKSFHSATQISIWLNNQEIEFLAGDVYNIPLQYLLYPAASKPDPVILLLKILQWLPGSLRVKPKVLKALYDLDSAPYHLDFISYFLPLTYLPPHLFSL